MDAFIWQQASQIFGGDPHCAVIDVGSNKTTGRAFGDGQQQHQAVRLGTPSPSSWLRRHLWCALAVLNRRTQEAGSPPSPLAQVIKTTRKIPRLVVMVVDVRRPENGELRLLERPLVWAEPRVRTTTTRVTTYTLVD